MEAVSESIPLGPVNERNGAALPRSPTLEAQIEPPRTRRKRRKAFLAFEDIPDDNSEQQLKDAISKSKGDARRFLRRLLNDYSRFRNNKSHGIGHELCQCFTITNGSQDGVKKSITPYIHLDAPMLKHWRKAKLISCSWINLLRSQNSLKHFLNT